MYLAKICSSVVCSRTLLYLLHKGVMSADIYNFDPISLNLGTAKI
jgi:hypothetical protein